MTDRFPEPDLDPAWGRDSEEPGTAGEPSEEEHLPNEAEIVAVEEAAMVADRLATDARALAMEVGRIGRMMVGSRRVAASSGAAPASPAVRTPKNAQCEPPYPGAETVVTSIRYPEQVVHRATARCAKESPHDWADCGEASPASPAVREVAAPRLASWAATLQVATHTENWGAVAEVQEAISAALAAEGERP